MALEEIEKVKSLYKEFEKQNNLKIWSLIFVTSFIYFIPLLSFFGYTLQLIIITHFVLSKRVAS